ncbi:MAG: hypothetical protein HY557_02080 [Euryarchaeota archaeon]|nr:hypothetical protein [Euryarchaeota archaeon]
MLILVGLLQAFDRGTHGAIAARIAGAFNRLAGGGEGPRSLFLYGFAYTAIGIGCTGPFLASVVVLGFTAGGFGPALLAFLVFALTMAALMVAVALVAHARPRSARVLGEKATRLKRWAGAALAAFGVLLAFLTVFPTALRPLFP